MKLKWRLKKEKINFTITSIVGSLIVINKYTAENLHFNPD